MTRPPNLDPCSVIIENTFNDTFAQRFQTKHTFLIFDVQETLYYLNVAFKNKMPHFKRLVKQGP